jgi:hypothetical protein
VKPIALGFLILAASAGAIAQPSTGSGPPDPMDARAPVAPVVHVSPFAQYRPFAAEVLGPWKAVNDEVGRIGGWKVYAREVYEATKQEEKASGAAGKPPTAPPDSDGQRAK